MNFHQVLSNTNGAHKTTNSKHWLFFVHPEEKQAANSTYVYGDHYTFCYDKGDQKTPIHFHSTTYAPLVQPANIIQHVTSHVKDFFTDDFDMSRDGDVVEIIKNPAHAGVRTLILRLMRRPWTVMSGAGKKRTNEARIQARTKLSDAFCEAWSHHECRALFAFGIRQPGGIVWSVRIVRKGREKANQMYEAYHFVTPTSDEREFQNRLASLL